MSGIKNITGDSGNQAGILRLLAAHGARFTLIPTRSKNPGYSGWQHGGKTLDDAERHARTGNVGLLCGSYSSNLIVIDADHTAQALEVQFPILTQTLKTFRADAPDRAKWIVRVVGDLPSSKKDHDAGIEILAGVSSGGGSNAVIYGVHDKGATIEAAGDAIVSLTQADIWDIWQWRTGKPWDAPITERKERARRTFAGGAAATPHNAGDLPDTPAVRRYNREHRIADELRRAGCTWLHSNRWLAPQQTTRQSSLSADERTNTAYAFSSRNPVGREGVIRCADIALQLDYGGDVDAFLSAISSDLPDFEHLKRVAQFGTIEPLVRQRLAELAGIAERKAQAAAQLYASNPTDEIERNAVELRKRADAAIAAATAPSWNEAAIRKFAVGMIDLFAQSASDTVRAGWLRLAAHLNASDKTVRRYAEVCEGWLFSVERSKGHANLYRLNTRVLSKVPDSTRVGTPHVHTLVESGTLPAPGDLYAHDAFCAALNPLADTPENRSIVGKTADAIRNGRNVKTMPVIPDGDVICTEGRHDAMPDRSWRAMLAKGYLAQSERRFWADLPSLGARGWLALVHLHNAGGTMAQSDLAAALGIKANRMSEVVSKLLTLEIVTKPDHHTLQLSPDWAEKLDNAVSKMPTYGSRARRESRYLQQSILHEESRMAEAFAVANADPAQVPAMEKRIEAIDRSITRRQARQAELLAIAEAIVGDMVREGNRRHPLIADLQRQIGTNEAREKAKHSMRLLNAGRRDHAEKQAIVWLAKRAGWLLRTLEPGQVLAVLRAEGNRERIAVGALRYAQGRAL
jgi:hypothetical protein